MISMILVTYFNAVLGNTFWEHPLKIHRFLSWQLRAHYAVWFSLNVLSELCLHWLSFAQSSYFIPSCTISSFPAELNISITRPILDHLWKCLIELLSVIILGRISHFSSIFIFMYVKGFLKHCSTYRYWSFLCVSLPYLLRDHVDQYSICRIKIASAHMYRAYSNIHDPILRSF